MPGSHQLYVVGKLDGRAVIAANATPGLPGRLGLLVDEDTGTPYLVDTGSVYSIVPHISEDSPTGPAITTANGKPIRCWGVLQKTVKAGGISFQWNFLLADIAFHIIGADFLSHFALTVDLRSRCLMAQDKKTFVLHAPIAGSTFAMIGVRPATKEREKMASVKRPEACVRRPEASVKRPQPESLLYNCGSTTTALHHHLYNYGSTREKADPP